MYAHEYEDGMVYDVVGDIHGHFDEMVALLRKLGYIKDYPLDIGFDISPQPNRKLVFIGDYIDRGPANLQTINLISELVSCGAAHAIMGNHDFNAVHYATPHPGKPGAFLRPHSDKNKHQHAAFLNEVDGDGYAYNAAIDWIKTLPVYLKIGNFNFVHACWQPSAIQTLIAGGYMDEEGVFTEKGWIESADPHSPAFHAAETLLKGPEENMATGYSYIDEQGETRSRSRVAWWAENPVTFGQAYASLPLNLTFRDAAYSPSADSLAQNIRDELRGLPPDERIFIGHIWESGTPKPLSERVVTVDYSVAKREKLACYSIKGARITLSPDDFIWVDVAAKDHKPERKDEPIPSSF